jgi:hypothetical protein
MKPSRLLLFSAVSALTFLPAMAAPAGAQEAGPHLVWGRIEGILAPGSLVGRPASGECNVGVDCVEGTPAAWVTTDGRADVNLLTGRIDFVVKGLVIASDPTFSNIGTTSVVTMVKGTLVCNDTEPGLPELVDTDAVALSPQGNARLHGRVDLPASCTDEPGDIVFLIRIADVSDPDRAFLIDLWNAFGAVRAGAGE